MILHPCIEAVAKRYAELDDQIRSGRLDSHLALSEYAWVAKDNTLGMARLSSAIPKNDGTGYNEADDDEMRIRFVVTTLMEDRDGDVVIPMGIQTDNFAKNAVWFLGHQQHPIPIAKGLSPDGRLGFYKEENRALADAWFDKEDPDSVFIYGKIKRGFLNATSIAFVPISATRRDREEEKGIYDRAHPHTQPLSPPGWRFSIVDLTEVSVVGVPSNSGAIRDSLDSEKSFISPRLQKAMLPYAAKSLGRSFSGWCPPGYQCVKGECVAKEQKVQVTKAADPTSMTAGQINRELDKIDAERSKLTDEMIDADRGHERPSDYQGKTDPLSMKIRALEDRRRSLRVEIELRYGPGAPSRLPPKFGPRKQSKGHDDDLAEEHGVVVGRSGDKWEVWTADESETVLSTRPFATEAEGQQFARQHGWKVVKAKTPAADDLGSRLAGHGVIFSVDAAEHLIIVQPKSMKETSFCQTAAQQTELKFPGWDVVVRDAMRSDAVKQKKSCGCGAGKARSCKGKQKAISASTFETLLSRMLPDSSKVIGGKSVRRGKKPPLSDTRFADNSNSFTIGDGPWLTLRAAAEQLFAASPVKQQKMDIPLPRRARDQPALYKPPIDWDSAFPSGGAKLSDGTFFGIPGFGGSDEDKHRLAVGANSELMAWRRAGEEHYAIPTAEGRMRHRPQYEQAYNALRAAWRRIGGKSMKRGVVKGVKLSFAFRSEAQASDFWDKLSRYMTGMDAGEFDGVSVDLDLYPFGSDTQADNAKRIPKIEAMARQYGGRKKSLGGGKAMKSHLKAQQKAYWVVDDKGNDVDGPHGTQAQAEAARTWLVSGPMRRAKLRVMQKAQPSDDVSPDKACVILHDGEANGEPLTDDQRRMFGAACGKKGLGRIGKANEPIPPPVHHLPSRQEAERTAKDQQPWWPAFKPVIGQDADGFYVKWTTKAMRKQLLESSGPQGGYTVAKGQKPAYDLEPGDVVRDGQDWKTVVSQTFDRGMYIVVYDDGSKQRYNEGVVLATKQLLESSGPEGGYTVAVESATTDIQAQGDAVCSECGGDGNCPGCGGTGQMDSGGMCSVCGGSGACPMCEGVGVMAKQQKSTKGADMATRKIASKRPAPKKAAKAPARKKEFTDGQKVRTPHGSGIIVRTIHGGNVVVELDQGGSWSGSASQVTAKAMDDEVEMDLADEGNPSELESGGDAGDQIIKDEDQAEDTPAELDDATPFVPKASALEAAKAYGQLKAFGDYFGAGGEGDLEKMDHPGMQEGLKALLEDEGPISKAMQHIKDLVTEHHAGGDDGDEYMEKLCKSLESENAATEPYQETKDDSFETGEDNLVDSGAVVDVPDEVEASEVGSDEWAAEEAAEPEHQDKDEGDADTEEIIERYRKNGKWYKRVVGVARRAKDGRVYIVRKEVPVNCPRCNGSGVSGGRECPRCNGTGGVDPNTIPPAKDLMDAGNPAELDHPPEPAGDGTIIKADDEQLNKIAKAADHLDAAAEHSETPQMHKAAHSYHAKALHEVHESLSNEGNDEELKGEDDLVGAEPAVEMALDDEGNAEELKAGVPANQCSQCDGTGYFGGHACGKCGGTGKERPKTKPKSLSTKPLSAAVEREFQALKQERANLHKQLRYLGINGDAN